ncbi:MAG: gephyrin-like molybdotransferase Glp [Pseudoruegeria sp.]
MISVSEALEQVLSLVSPLSVEEISLHEASGRHLAQPVLAKRDQPPFASSAMDGYAIPDAEVSPGLTYSVIGESAAGHRFQGNLNAGEAVRIFTGAPVPMGGNRIIIQEDVARSGDTIRINDNLDPSLYIRPAGGDFKVGDGLSAPRALTPSDLSLIAAMNCPKITVYRKPVVALIATGDELVMPGDTPNQDQIIASNSFALKALFETYGAVVRLLPIARDNEASLKQAFELANGADLIVTTGGASVGDHDLVAPVADRLGMERSFYKVAMRPGKPLMAGKLGNSVMIGLPGNPVSSIVCAHIFILPMLKKMTGQPGEAMQRYTATLASDIGPNSPREHYMRAILLDGQITPFSRQDSSLLSVLSDANCLMVRAPKDCARKAGDTVEYIPL